MNTSPLDLEGLVRRFRCDLVERSKGIGLFTSEERSCDLRKSGFESGLIRACPPRCRKWGLQVYTMIVADGEPIKGPSTYGQSLLRSSRRLAITFTLEVKILVFCKWLHCLGGLLSSKPFPSVCCEMVPESIANAGTLTVVGLRSR